MKAWQRGNLDACCRQCGETMPARRVCYHCHSTDLEYREHLSWPGRAGEKIGPKPIQWCEQRHHYPERTPRPPRDVSS